MSWDMHCPVCGEKYENAYDDYIEHILCEYGHSCKHKHYGTQYAYGATETWVGHRTWYESHTDSPEHSKRVTEQIRRAVEREKAKWEATRLKQDGMLNRITVDIVIKSDKLG